MSYIKYVAIASLDINLLLKLFWSVNHFRGIIAIYTLALSDYCAPVEEFVKFIDRAEDDPQSETGNTILVYLASTLDGVDMEGKVIWTFFLYSINCKAPL